MLVVYSSSFAVLCEYDMTDSFGSEDRVLKSAHNRIFKIGF